MPPTPVRAKQAMASNGKMKALKASPPGVVIVQLCTFVSVHSGHEFHLPILHAIKLDLDYIICMEHLCSVYFIIASPSPNSRNINYGSIGTPAIFLQ